MKAIQKVQWYAFLTLLCFGLGCEDFLNKEPQGTTTLNILSEQLNGAEALLIAAYSNLDGHSLNIYPDFYGSGSNWTFGSIAGGDAYKGSEEGDQFEITDIEVHSTLNALNPYLEAKWTTYYNGIARANDAIKAFQSLPEKDIKDEFRSTRIAEARFLRGFFHFELRKTFGDVPYIDETITDTRIGKTENILVKIQDDFNFSIEYLPDQQEQIGRITKGAANAYMGITKMWQEDYVGAKVHFELVISSGLYQLNETFHANFNVESKNEEKEAILQVQQSVNDHSNGLNGNPGDVLNAPFYAGSCCGFHLPSQNLANAFQTDADGLPLLYTYNDVDIVNDDTIDWTESFTPHTGPLDPRIDWTMGRRGIPYLDRGNHVGNDWIRGNEIFAGPYSPKKYILYKSQEERYAEHEGWALSYTANNFKVLRYAEVLLLLAEAEVELENFDRAMELVNMIRNRAANPLGWVYTYKDPENPSLGFTNTPAANYFIKLYPPGHFTSKGQIYARDAVRFERRLELGMEGQRFFDLVRWKIAAEVKNAYFEKEKTKRDYLKAGLFTEGTNEVYPIPQKALDRSSKDGLPTLVQNPGYN